MMRGLFLIFFLGAALAPSVLQAQQPEKQKGNGKDFPNTLQPVNPAKVYAPPKKKKKKEPGATYDARDEYNDRMDALLKERLKKDVSGNRLKEDERMKPPYFGHKRPPKIRPIGKRKYCKVCGIRH